MREILFRGKTDKGEWIEGFYIKDVIETYIYDKYRNTRMQSVIPSTVGQYTGLRDCKRTEQYPKGQMIFEGDILKGSWNTVLVIFYDEISTSYRVKTSTGHEREPSYYGIEKFEVIGNIHDNNLEGFKND